MSALLLILFFSGRWIGRISLEKKRGEGQGVDYYMNYMLKFQVHFRKIDRGMANLPFKQGLSWLAQLVHISCSFLPHVEPTSSCNTIQQAV